MERINLIPARVEASSSVSSSTLDRGDDVVHTVELIALVTPEDDELDFLDQVTTKTSPDGRLLINGRFQPVSVKVAGALPIPATTRRRGRGSRERHRWIVCKSLISRPLDDGPKRQAQITTYLEPHHMQTKQVASVVTLTE